MTAALLLSMVCLAGDLDPGDAPGDVMPDRHWDFQHLHLDVRVDPAAGTVAGRAVHRVEPLGRPYSWVRLYQTALDVSEVRVDGVVVSGWRIGPDTIDIPVKPGVAHEVSVAYTATPTLGMHFRKPVGGALRIPEAWTQGEDQDHRHWFPGWDYPNDRFTFSADVTVPEGLHATANGDLKGTRAADPGWTTWSYALEHDLVNYLVGIAIGDYAVYQDEGAARLEYVVPKWVDDATARRSLAFAKPQLAFFNDLLGTPYPYGVYRQVVVQGFMYGGMENTTLTVLNERALVLRDGQSTAGVESLVAHELAHQWFGDLLTCYGWRELWLNEGFATFYAARWMEHAHGAESAAVWTYRRQQGAARDAAPMAARGWSKVGDRPNVSVYDRGASVLHMLRIYLGDDVFDAGIRRYVASNAHSLVETDTLRRELEEVSGTHLGWLFDQWVYGREIRDLKSSWSWSPADGGQLTVRITQPGDATPLHAPIEVEVGTAEGVGTRHLWLGEQATLVVDLPEAPEWVAVDPRGGVLARWDHSQSAKAWTAQLLRSPSAYARVVAMKQIGAGQAGPAQILALRQVLLDAALHVDFRKEAAGALGALKTDDAETALQAGLAAPTWQIREECAKQVGTPSAAALANAARVDPQVEVRAAALATLGRVAGKKALPQAKKVVARGWARPTAPELHAALGVFGEHGSASDVPRLAGFLDAKNGRKTRTEAAAALVKLAMAAPEGGRDAVRGKVSRLLEPWLVDPDIRVRSSGIQHLGRVGDAEAERSLVALASRTHVDWLRDEARDAAQRIRTGDPDRPAPTEDDLERMAERIHDVEERLDDVEKWR